MNEINLEMLEKAKAIVKKYESVDNAIKKFFDIHGFSVDNGDIMIIPTSYFYKYPYLEDHKNVRVSNLVDDILLVRNPLRT